MSDELMPFTFPESGTSSIIKVIGVGGGGGNAVNHMYREGIHDVTFVVCNTDNQALEESPVPQKIQLGSEGLDLGLGQAHVKRKAAMGVERRHEDAHGIRRRRAQQAGRLAKTRRFGIFYSCSKLRTHNNLQHYVEICYSLYPACIFLVCFEHDDESHRREATRALSNRPRGPSALSCGHGRACVEQ